VHINQGNLGACANPVQCLLDGSECLSPCTQLQVDKPHNINSFNKLPDSLHDLCSRGLDNDACTPCPGPFETTKISGANSSDSCGKGLWPALGTTDHPNILDWGSAPTPMRTVLTQSNHGTMHSL
jgi:hypothetical protein